MSSLLKVIGLDPSLRNWGVVVATLDQASNVLTVQSVSVIQPDLSSLSTKKQNLLDLASSIWLYSNVLSLIKDADIICAEIPQGSQSARASMASGICLGVLGSLANQVDLPFITVSPHEVKLAGYGSRLATKKQMIEWAVAKHPEAIWPMYKSNGQMVINEGKAEHMCDALAAIYAGMNHPAFITQL